MTDDHDVERLLARGQPGGPRLDRIWDQVAPQVVAAPHKVPWWQRGWMMFIPLVPVAALVLFMVLPSSDGLTPRGISRVPPLLETTCGIAATPCKVGDPVYLRLVARRADGVVYVRLLATSGATPVAGPLPARGDEAVAVPARLVPDAADVARGLDVEATWLPAAVEEKELAAALTAAADNRSVLHLMVTP